MFSWRRVLGSPNSQRSIAFLPRHPFQHLSATTSTPKSTPLFASLSPVTIPRPALLHAHPVTSNWQPSHRRWMSLSAKSEPEEGKSIMLEVKFKDGKTTTTTSKFDYFWLRDHCKCELCWHPTTKQRLHDTFSVPMDVKPVRVEYKGDKLVITWNHENHVSTFDLDWLKRHSYDPALMPPPKPTRPKFLWSVEKIKSVPTPVTSYESVMKGDGQKGLAQWLSHIDTYGFATVSGVPVTPEDTEKLAKRICFIRESHYGGFWDFTANMAHGDTAYTNLAIGSHTDSTYFTDPVGLQLFHLLKHDGEGGKTLLVDGFHVAETMRKKYPREFEVLSTFRIPTHSAGDTEILIRPTPLSGFPLINLHPHTGEIYQIRYNNHDRSVLSPYYNPKITTQQIRDFYSALKVWRELVVDEKNQYWYKMQPGTAIVVDNWRVMHGRSSFTGQRRLCGAYLNWDDYRSRVAMVVDGGKEKENL